MIHTTLDNVPALVAEQLQLDLDGKRILHDINLSIGSGRWLSIVGPNGGGKSSLLRALAGLVNIQGDVRLHGKSLRLIPSRQRARVLTWLGNDVPTAQDWRVYDVVMLGLLPHQAWLATPSLRDETAVKHALLQVHLWEKRDDRMQQLSAGEQQRVLLARAFVTATPILLMDEPLTHLDPPHQSDWLRQIRTLVTGGTTVISVLHDIPMALHADEVLVLNQGRICHHASSKQPETHRALEAVFDHRWIVRSLEGQWVWLPVLG